MKPKRMTTKLFIWQVGYSDEIEGRWAIMTGAVRARTPAQAEVEVRKQAFEEGWHDSEHTCEIAISAVPDDATFTVAEGDFGAVILEETCSECGEPCDDGEGWDGMCGNCADKADSEDA